MQLHVGGKVYDVVYTENPWDIQKHIISEPAKFITYDTETTGLHLRKDKPFLAAVCFNNVVYVLPATYQFFAMLVILSKKVNRVYAHNTTYDMHMMGNIGGDKMPLLINNWGDTQGLARLSFESIGQDQPGGHKLSLKYIGRKFIDTEADVYEKEVKTWITEERKARLKILVATIRSYTKETGWTQDRVKKMLAEKEPIPIHVQELFDAWAEDYPPVTYQDVPMEIMLPYVAVDVILTQQLVYMALPIIVKKEQVKTMNREFRLISTVYKIERRGIETDRQYLIDSKTRMNEYMEKLYVELHELTGIDDLSVNQHQKVKELYELWLGEVLTSSDKQFLNRMSREYKDSKEGRVGWLISTLRRCEKWMSTYINKILRDSEYNGRFYTQLNQFSPVTGRFSGDAQQFPKEAIEAKSHLDEKDAPEIFHPRRAFKGSMYYLDYSQVELRVQGHYTLMFGGDTNLCRAYMPFQCTHEVTGEVYNFSSMESRSRWNELRNGHPDPREFKDGLEDVLKQGWSVWITPEGKPWIPTDVHGATTVKALTAMGIDINSLSKDEFKMWRYTGKRFNFMRNYGGGDKKAAETLEISIEAARAMNRGYSEAFPMVLDYQRWIEAVMYNQGYFEHQLGRRYYINDSWRYYKVANYAIQGLCADYLKEKMIAIDDYMEANSLWDTLPMILCVHDELQFENVSGNPALEQHIWNIKAIMEDTPDILLPIVAEVEKTFTNWAEKKTLHQDVA